jgi:asparagine synthase (glutamine-hydrolysing)
MCAITGLIDLNQTSSEGILKNMTDTMIHRGPDGGDQKLFEESNFQLGFGHRRLSIIDLSEHASQPMQFENLWLCFNGEVYNFQEIKEELITLGHTFKTQSDTEMILHAFAEWGNKCLDKFIGMFAFVIYDTQNQRVFCARDRAGVKPLFYYFKDGLFLFSSELKAFHQHPKFQKQINKDAVAAYMQFGNVPAPHCIFDSCFKLKPGHYFEFNISDLTPNWKPNLKEYWNVYDAYNKPKSKLPFAEAKKETEKVLQTACEYRMIADVPVGVFLSGGFDSACVTSLLQKDRTEKLKTFTIAVPDIGLNEAPYAKDVAKHLGTDHTEVECNQKEALDLIPKIPFFYDEPFGDSSAIPTTLVCKMARKDVTVALSADAGDEVFAGYNRYDYLMKFGGKINSMPSVLRKSFAGMMNVIPADKIPVLKNKYNFANRYEKLKGILRNPSPEQIMLSLSRQFDDVQIAHLMNTETKPLELAYFSTQLKAEFHSPLSYMLAIDYQTYLPDDILQKVDRASMTSSLEGREPFLDHNVVEWAAQLPDDFKYHNGIKKHILREIVYDYIPKELLDRPKMGFAIPIEDWMMNELREQVREALSTDKIKAQGIFNPLAVSQIVEPFLAGKKELGLKVWYLYMFQAWYGEWM